MRSGGRGSSICPEVDPGAKLPTDTEDRLRLDTEETLAEEHEQRLRAEGETREVQVASAAEEERRQAEAGGGGEGADAGGGDLLLAVGHRGAIRRTKRACLGIYYGVGGPVLAQQKGQPGIHLRVGLGLEEQSMKEMEMEDRR